MSQGIFYAVSTGAGNPEQITLEAIRVLRDCDVIFYPETERTTIALDSLSEAGLSHKTLIPCHFSMTRDKEKTDAEYKTFASKCTEFLSNGKNTAFLSIGDVSLYSSAERTALLIQDSGFQVKFIAGVNSFSAAACSATLALCGRDEALTVIPGDAFYSQGKLSSALKTEGTKILMKMARHLKEIISLLDEQGLIQNATLVQKASLPDEKIFRSEAILHLSEDDYDTAYLSVLIIKS